MVLFQISTPDFAVVTSKTECERMDQLCSSAMNKKLCNIPLLKKGLLWLCILILLSVLCDLVNVF